MAGEGEKSILTLEIEGGNTTDPKLIKDAIYEFYKKLFGKKSKKLSISLSLKMPGPPGVDLMPEIMKNYLSRSQRQKLRK